MSIGKAIALGGASLVAVAAASEATPAIPFLDTPLWHMYVMGSLAVMTVGTLFATITFLLGAAVMLKKLLSRDRRD